MMGEAEFSSSGLGTLPAFSSIRDELEKDKKTERERREGGSSLKGRGEGFFGQMRTSDFLR